MFLDNTSFLLFYSCLYNATFPSFMFIYLGLFFDVHFKVARCLWHAALPTYLPRKLAWGGVEGGHDLATTTFDPDPRVGRVLLWRHSYGAVEKKA